MGNMELVQKQTLQLNQKLIHRLDILQMSSLELDEYLNRLSQENPMIDIEETRIALNGESKVGSLQSTFRYGDFDYQNRYYNYDQVELNPIDRISSDGGFEETLEHFLMRQVDALGLDETRTQVVHFLIECLDDNGYFMIPLPDLALETELSIGELECALDIIRSLEPAGVGAANLAQCLELQLNRIRYNGPALSIVRECLPLLAKHHYRAIGTKLKLSQKEIAAAEKVIHQLEPRPGKAFQTAEPIHYIEPDIIVTEEEKTLIIQVRERTQSPFQINQYYRSLLSQTSDQQVKDYLSSKLRQAEETMAAIKQRNSTLTRCAQAIVDYQQDFFRHGPQSLRQLRMLDVAQELGVHVSTVSRTIRGKYIQCMYGLYPMRYFFAQGMVADQNIQTDMGAVAIKNILKNLIETENKNMPMSDQRIAEEMARIGCPLSRRTIAKYREEMGIPSVYGRKL